MHHVIPTPAFIATMNSDPTVSDAIHVGDIHSGKEFCIEDYDTSIASMWQTFTKPLIYTPGDNERADCHKAPVSPHPCPACSRPLTPPGTS